MPFKQNAKVKTNNLNAGSIAKLKSRLTRKVAFCISPGMAKRELIDGKTLTTTTLSGLVGIFEHKFVV